MDELYAALDEIDTDELLTSAIAAEQEKGSNSGATDLDVVSSMRSSWMDETGKFETLGQLLVNRKSVMEYCTQNKIKLPEGHLPPETMFSPDKLTLFVPRMYTPYSGYPVGVKTDTEGRVIAYVPRLLRDITAEEAPSQVVAAILDSIDSRANFSWMLEDWSICNTGLLLNSKAISRVSMCYMSDEKVKLPMHVFDSTTEYEKTMRSSDVPLMSIYSGQSRSTCYFGIYGALHGNTLVDVRPYEEDGGLAEDESNSNDKFRPELREPREDLLGFVCAAYTPPNTEAGRMRAFALGCIIRQLTDRVVYNTKYVLSALLSLPGRHDVEFPDCKFVFKSHTASEIERKLDCRSCTLYFCGYTAKVTRARVAEAIARWLELSGHEIPSLHFFNSSRVVVVSLAPGCIMKPYETTSRLPSEFDRKHYVDSIIFNNREMMQTYGFKKPSRSNYLEYMKAFFSLVPYLSFNQPPRPLLASGVSTQAICTPRVEVISTMASVSRSFPTVRTKLMHQLCLEVEP
jgi:hypothetical protein